MSIFSRFFSKTDPRDVLANGEEWVYPENWFTDADGKRVRRKNKKCCGGRCHTSVAPETEPFPMMELPLLSQQNQEELPDAEDEKDEDTPLEALDEKNQAPATVNVAQELVKGLTDFADAMEKNPGVPVVEIVDYYTINPPSSDNSSSSSNFDNSDNSGTATIE